MDKLCEDMRNSGPEGVRNSSGRNSYVINIFEISTQFTIHPQEVVGLFQKDFTRASRPKVRILSPQ
jgi:hypothetical protein